MKNIKYTFALLIVALFISCTEDDVATDSGDLYLDHQVPNIPVTSDYQVGAHYYKINVLNREADPTIQPTIGLYNLNPPPDQQTIYAQHLEQAKTAGIDFFLYDFRSAAFNSGNTQIGDIRFLDSLQATPGADEIKMALSYNFGGTTVGMELSNNNRIEDAGHVQTFIDDFKEMIPFFDRTNYMKIGNANVVYITNGQNLHSEDNVQLYQDLRTELLAEGHDLYIIGSQPQWTPPLKWDFRFKGCVDALTHLSYIRVNRNTYDRFLYFHTITDLALQYHKERLDDFEIEYIPTISPSVDLSFNSNVNDDDNLYVIPKEVEFFKKTCNVARNASGNNKLILIDSFNNWNVDTQIESDNANEDTYLKIVKEEFKVNQ